MIEAGADKTARTFGGMCYTPLSDFTSRIFTQDGLVDAIDTCRIFNDSYDFWDEFGDGWAILDRSMSLDIGSDDRASTEFSKWFVQSSSPDIKAYYDKTSVSNIIHYASPGRLDSISMLLELGPTGIVDHDLYGRTSLIQSIGWRDFDKARMFLALGADPHHSSFSSDSSRVESPLSMAMYSSWTFCFFRDDLMEMNFHVKDIVCRELEQGGPLLDDGWQAETLSALLKFNFELKFQPPRIYYNQCSNCNCHISIFDVMVQPYWQDILERIKNGTYVQKPCSDTQDVQSSSSERHPLKSDEMFFTNTADGGTLSQDRALVDDSSFRSDEERAATESTISELAPGEEEIWCFRCWTHFKETGRRYSPPVTGTFDSDEDDSSEDDFSPFLFNT